MLIIKAAQSARAKLRKEWKRLYYEEKDHDEARKINQEKDAISRALSKSICMCAACGSAKKDMVFNPNLKSWLCVNCYDLNQEYYRTTGQD